jgi:hypothetical protein
MKLGVIEHRGGVSFPRGCSNEKTDSLLEFFKQMRQSHQKWALDLSPQSVLNIFVSIDNKPRRIRPKKYAFQRRNNWAEFSLGALKQIESKCLWRYTAMKSKPKKTKPKKTKLQAVLPQTAPPQPPTGIDRIIQIASGSNIAHYEWKDRGVAPAGYIKGMAVVFARVYCKLRAGDAAATEMAKATTNDGTRDALAWYSERFEAAGMSNDNSGAETLRHLFVLLMGLGMRESSGRYCEGRDRSASNVTANTAEAGLFQTSFNARTASPLLPQLFTQYSENPSGFVEIFKEGVHCKSSDLENFGSGTGRDFQRLSKECPAFAAEFAGVCLRNLRTHYGPINTRAAEIRTAADAMLRQVQDAVDASNLCSAVT